MSDLVSIIIPCYRQSQFLGECIQSLQKQTHQNWEAIIVDDGSPDDTRDIALRLSDQDKRVHYVHKVNGGLSSARNTGIANSKGQYIQLLDADDLLDTDKLYKHVEVLKNRPKIDLVYGSAWYFKNGNFGVFDRGPYAHNPEHDWITENWNDPRPLLTKLIQKNILPVCAPLFRRSVVERVGFFNEELDAGEDWDYWIRCSIDNIDFEYCNEAGTDVFIRRHGASMTDDMQSSGILLSGYMLREHYLTKLPPGDARDLSFNRLLRLNARLGNEDREQRYRRIKCACISSRERLIVKISKLCDAGGYLYPISKILGSRMPWRFRRKLTEMGLSFVDL